VQDLESLRLPDGYRAAVLTGSNRRYRIRLESLSSEPDGTVCWVWGQRGDPETIEPFDIDCAHRSR